MYIYIYLEDLPGLFGACTQAPYILVFWGPASSRAPGTEEPQASVAVLRHAERQDAATLADSGYQQRGCHVVLLMIETLHDPLLLTYLEFWHGSYRVFVGSRRIQIISSRSGVCMASEKQGFTSF